MTLRWANKTKSRMTEPFPKEADFSTKFLQDKNWKIFRKSTIVNGISFKLKTLHKLGQSA